MKAECRCALPVEYPNPTKQGVCVKCDRWLNPEWLSSDATLSAFFRRLSEALPPGEAESDSWCAFRAQCEAREYAGRDKFGMEYLVRSNTTEALEETADLALYAFLDSLKQRRDQGSDEDFDLVLMGAFHAYKAHETMRHLRSRRHGAP